MMKRTKIVPKRRFKGFYQDWELQELGNIAKITMGHSPRGENYTNNPQDFILVQGNADMKNGYVVPRIWTTQITKMAEAGDLIMSVRAPVGEIGKSAYSVVIGRGVAAIKGNEFIYQSLKKMDSEGYWKQFSSGSTFDSINSEDLKKALITVTDMKEQAVIGDFFHKIDNLISLQQRKLEKTKALKTAYLSELFPAEGEFVPKRRFAGFTQDWEERSFFENVKNTIDFRGRTPKKLGLEWSKTGYLALSALNVKNGYIDFSVDNHYGNQELYDKWMAGRELKKGQVLFTTEAPMGNVAQVPDNRGYILSQRTIAFEVNPEKITNDFLASLLRSPKVFAELSALSSGGTAKGVSQKTLSQLKVKVPKNLEEQFKIGTLLNEINHLITLHERKLEKLQNLKKAYLHEMFV